MTVSKAVDLVGEGASVEEAVLEAVDRAGATLEAVTAFEILRVRGVVDAGRCLYQVEVRVWFTLLERMHG